MLQTLLKTYKLKGKTLTIYHASDIVVIRSAVSGKAGRLCERDATACDREPCVHGTCHLTSQEEEDDDQFGFSCDCTGTGYAGIYCENFVDHCLGEPCSNGGTCQNHPTGYTCVCHQNFTGKGKLVYIL